MGDRHTLLENKEQETKQLDVSQPQHVSQTPKVQTAIAFWDAWLADTSFDYNAEDECGERIETSNKTWLLKTAFAEYVVRCTKHSKTHLFLLLRAYESDNYKVQIGSGSREDLQRIAGYVSVSAIHDYLHAPPDPAYYLLLFMRDDILLCFRKRLNPTPYAASTSDTESVLAFYQQCGSYNDPMTHLLADDP